MKENLIDEPFLKGHKQLTRSGKSFFNVFTIYKYKTRIQFVYDTIGKVRVYLHQEYPINKESTILLGVVTTESELNNLLKSLRREDG